MNNHLKIQKIGIMELFVGNYSWRIPSSPHLKTGNSLKTLITKNDIKRIEHI